MIKYDQSAGVVELADTLDLGSNVERHAGSSPVARTKKPKHSCMQGSLSACIIVFRFFYVFNAGLQESECSGEGADNQQKKADHHDCGLYQMPLFDGQHDHGYQIHQKEELADPGYNGARR